jgi:hypothetical protein
VEEDDAEVRSVVVRLDDVAAVHIGVTAWLEDEQPAHVVEPFERVAPLLEDRLAGQGLDAAGDDPERLAAGVVVDGADHERLSISAAPSSILLRRGTTSRRSTCAQKAMSSSRPGGP